jgi:hypothetical protein
MTIKYSPESAEGGIVETPAAEPAQEKIEKSFEDEVLGDDPEPQSEPEGDDDPDSPWLSQKQAPVKESLFSRQKQSARQGEMEIAKLQKRQIETEAKMVQSRINYLASIEPKNGTIGQYREWEKEVEKQNNLFTALQGEYAEADKRAKGETEPVVEINPDMLTHASRELDAVKKYWPKIEREIASIQRVPTVFADKAEKSQVPMSVIYMLKKTGKLEALKDASEYEAAKAWDAAEKDVKNFFRVKKGAAASPRRQPEKDLGNGRMSQADWMKKLAGRG